MLQGINKILSIGFTLIILFLVVFLIIYYGFARVTKGPTNPDIIRIEDISNIRRIMEVYYHSNNNLQYFQSTTTPLSIREFTLPLDPEGYPYGWIDNTADSQKFCVWAKLEGKGTYYIATPLQEGEMSYQPTSLNECYKLSSP